MKSPNLSVKANRLNVNGVTTALLRKGVLRQLSQLRHGQLVLIEDGERQVFGAREAHLVERGEARPLLFLLVDRDEGRRGARVGRGDREHALV